MLSHPMLTKMWTGWVMMTQNLLNTRLSMQWTWVWEEPLSGPSTLMTSGTGADKERTQSWIQLSTWVLWILKHCHSPVCPNNYNILQRSWMVAPWRPHLATQCPQHSQWQRSLVVTLLHLMSCAMAPPPFTWIPTATAVSINQAYRKCIESMVLLTCGSCNFQASTTFALLALMVSGRSPGASVRKTWSGLKRSKPVTGLRTIQMILVSAYVQ